VEKVKEKNKEKSKGRKKVEQGREWEEVEDKEEGKKGWRKNWNMTSMRRQVKGIWKVAEEWDWGVGRWRGEREWKKRKCDGKMLGGNEVEEKKGGKKRESVKLIIVHFLYLKFFFTMWLIHIRSV
jgi:hypothetical protein